MVQFLGAQGARMAEGPSSSAEPSPKGFSQSGPGGGLAGVETLAASRSEFPGNGPSAPTPATPRHPTRDPVLTPRVERVAAVFAGTPELLSEKGVLIELAKWLRSLRRRISIQSSLGRFSPRSLSRRVESSFSRRASRYTVKP